MSPVTVALLCFGSFYLGMALMALICAAGFRPRLDRRPKRPGYVHLLPSASGSASRTTAATRTRTGTFTASKTLTEAMRGHPAYPGANRIASPTDSSSGTASSPGAPMTDADRRELAARILGTWPEPRPPDYAA